MTDGIILLPDGRTARFVDAIPSWRSDDPELQAALNAAQKRPEFLHSALQLYEYSAHPAFQHFYDMVLLYNATILQHPHDTTTYPPDVIF